MIDIVDIVNYICFINFNYINQNRLCCYDIIDIVQGLPVYEWFICFFHMDAL